MGREGGLETSSRLPCHVPRNALAPEREGRTDAYTGTLRSLEALGVRHPGGIEWVVWEERAIVCVEYVPIKEVVCVSHRVP